MRLRQAVRLRRGRSGVGADDCAAPVLDHISPIFPPFFLVFCVFSPSRPGGSSEPQAGTQGQEIAGTRYGYGADVVASEPMVAPHPFMGVDNIVLTPHVGSRTNVRTQDS